MLISNISIDVVKMAVDAALYTCAITHELAEAPVIAQDGHLYELEAIDRWVAAHGTSPIARTAMARLYVRPAVMVAAYAAFREKSGLVPLDLPVGTIDKRPTSIATEDSDDDDDDDDDYDDDDDANMSHLMRAVETRDERGLASALAASNVPLYDLNQALRAACVDRLPTFVCALLNAGADVNYEWDLGLRALWYPVFYCDIDLVRILLARGADPTWDNHCILKKVYPLSAQFPTRTELLRLLVAAGARDTGVTGPHANFALLTAVASGNLAAVECLHAAGADLRQNDDHMLQAACAENHLHIVRYLLDHGADPNAYGGLLLRDARRNGATELVQLLERPRPN